MSKILTLNEIDINKLRVFLRVDYNCVKDGKVIDDFRVKQSLDTIKYLLDRQCSIVIASHNDRPEGKYEKSMSLRPVAQVLANMIKRPVGFVDDCIGKNSFKEARELKPGEVLLLENLRFHKGEEKNSSKFAKSLSALADVYVDDAFANAHRKHASMVAITKYLPHVAGLLMQKEYETITKMMDKPAEPFTAIVGGSKISTKIDFLNKLLEVVNTIFVGGAMANTFLASQGYDMASSFYEPKYVKTARSIIDAAKKKGVNLVLPNDLVVAKQVKTGVIYSNLSIGDLKSGDIALDIGRDTMKNVRPLVNSSKTIFWNGTLGMTEIDEFSKASRELTKMISAKKKSSMTVVGGGDTAGFVQSINALDDFTFVSTGGGASLELVSGNRLPAIEVLLR